MSILKIKTYIVSKNFFKNYYNWIRDEEYNCNDRILAGRFGGGLNLAYISNWQIAYLQERIKNYEESMTEHFLWYNKDMDRIKKLLYFGKTTCNNGIYITYKNKGVKNGK